MRETGALTGLLALMCIAVGCDKADSTASPTQSDAGGGVAMDATSAKSDASSEPDQGVPDAAAKASPPLPLRLPWTTAPLAPEDVAKIATDATPIGKLSGEVYGKDSPVYKVLRHDCGAGTILQAVYQHEGKVQVTPGMPVRFFGLATGKPVRYGEGEFEVTVDFKEDAPQRLQGALSIGYVEEGRLKLYAHLEVDGAPTVGLVPPKLSGEGKLPSFPQCVSSGYIRLKEKGQPEQFGYVNALDAPPGVASIRPMLSAQDGLRIHIVPPPGAKGVKTEAPMELVKAKEKRTYPAVVLVDAWHLPELAAPAEANGGNVGREQTVGVTRGTIEFEISGKGSKQRVHALLRNVEIPELVEGRLRGRQLEELEIDASLFGPKGGTLPPAPTWWQAPPKQGK